MAQEFLHILALDQTHWLLTIGLILIFAPLERIFPKVKARSAKPELLTVFIVAICSFGAVWLFKKYIYLDMISVFLKLQIFSISKSNFSLQIIYFISFLLIDFLFYLFHFLSHKVSFLWKLHSVHHADEEVNAKTGILHHPFEVLASLFFIMFFSVVLGIPLLALILYAAISTIYNIFVHANIALPISLDRPLRKIFVTPDVHRTHHSVELREGNSNFGQVLTIWDRIFGTYTDRPASGEENLVMGLPNSERPTGFSVKHLLFHPFASFFGRKKSNN